MTIQTIHEEFSVCKVADYGGIDLTAPFVFTGSTDEEKSLVCPVRLVPANTLEREDGWRAFRIEGTLEFSLVGILADLSRILAEGNIGIFAISTFNTDYILTKTENFTRAIELLTQAGYSVDQIVVNKPPFRPMRRSKQALPEEECFRILGNAYRGFLSVNGDGGYPYSVPINFVFEDGKLYFHCAKEGHKLDAIRVCDKACFTVLDEPEKEPGDWWYHVKSVICFGRVGIVDDEQERMDRLRSLAGKYFPAGYDTESDILRNGPKAEILAFTIEHISGKAVREK